MFQEISLLETMIEAHQMIHSLLLCILNEYIYITLGDDHLLA